MNQKPTRIYAASGPGLRAVYVSTYQGEKEKFFHIEVYRRKADGKLIEYQSLLSETTLFMLMLALSGAARDNDMMKRQDDIGYSAFTYDEAVAAGVFGPDPESKPEEWKMRIRLKQDLDIHPKHGAREGKEYEVIRREQEGRWFIFRGATGEECAAYPHEVEVLEGPSC